MGKGIFGQGNGWFIKTKLTLLLLAMTMPIAGWDWSAGGASSLAGRWEWVLPEGSPGPKGFLDRFELLKDGNGLGGGKASLKWSAENGRLMFRFDAGDGVAYIYGENGRPITHFFAGQGVAYTYQVSGSTLILTNDDGQSVKYMQPEKAKAEKKAAADEAPAPLVGQWFYEGNY